MDTTLSVLPRLSRHQRDASVTRIMSEMSELNASARPAQSGMLGKYREIIIAVGFFLLFDLGVLVLNFYTSFQIGEDAKAINLSGRQRMLSQRTTKAVYAVQDRVASLLPVDEDLKELANATQLFDATLKSLRQGGTVVGGDGKPTTIRRLENPKAIELLDDAQKIWVPLLARTQAMSTPTAQQSDVAEAVAFARQNNLKLLNTMNQLTTELETEAAERASFLRMVQTVGIVLAMLNFVFILFKFIRRLRTSDAAIEAANEENREILASVREGLFLMTPDMRLGTQMAASVSELFGRRVKAGENFIQVLAPLVSEKTLEDARSYVGLLFSPHVKEALVQSINPLNEVSIQVESAPGVSTPRHLSFHFNRVLEEDGSKVVRHLLVTVQDISQRIELEKKLQQERSRAEKEFSMFLHAIEAEPTTFRMFIERAEAAMLEVNDLLRSTAQADSPVQVLKAIDGAFRRVHAVKGEAGALGLEVLAQIAHQFENSLQSIREQPDIGPEALLSLPLPLEDLLSKIAALKKLIRQDRARAAAEDWSPQTLAQQLEQVAQKVATDMGKQVQTHGDLQGVSELKPTQLDLVREIMVQLVRNAVVHGVEFAQERQDKNKPVAGQIELGLHLDAIGNAELIVKDDGAGLSVAKVRSKLLELGWYDEESVAQLSDRQIMAQIFKAGFSTATDTNLHAGRGVGLDVVQAHVEQLGGQLMVSTVAGVHTTFRIRFAV